MYFKEIIAVLFRFFSFFFSEKNIFLRWDLNLESKEEHYLIVKMVNGTNMNHKISLINRAPKTVRATSATAGLQYDKATG